MSSHAHPRKRRFRLLPRSPRTGWMVFVGTVFLFRGIEYLDPASAESLPRTLARIEEVVPIGFWAILWVLSGVVAIATANTRYWIQGIVGLAMITAVWFLGYTSAFVEDMIFHGDSGAGLAALAYGALVASAISIARMIDPEDLRAAK